MAKIITILLESLLAGLLLVFLLHYLLNGNINEGKGLMEGLGKGAQTVYKTDDFVIDHKITEEYSQATEPVRCDVRYVGGILQLDQSYKLCDLFTGADIEILNIPSDAVYDRKNNQITFHEQGSKKIQVYCDYQYDMYFTIPVAYESK